MPLRQNFYRSSRGENKIIQARRKYEIQNAFREQTGLLLDVVIHGKGSSNDGNTARRFFSDCEKSAAITGFDQNILKRFSAILQAMSSGLKIDTDKFDQYGMETAKLFVEKYPWYFMPVSVHKVLIHGKKIN